MGIFDFVKDAGGKLAGLVGLGDDTEKNRETAGALGKLVGDMGLEVKNLSVGFDDGIATLRGEAATQSVSEKATLLVGNTAGVAQVDNQMTIAPPKPEVPLEPPAAFYTVQRGDTLSKIAKEYYGNAMKYPTIFEANRPMLKDPDRIFPGQVLRIPPLDK